MVGQQHERRTRGHPDRRHPRAHALDREHDLARRARRARYAISTATSALGTYRKSSDSNTRPATPPARPGQFPARHGVAFGGSGGRRRRGDRVNITVLGAGSWGTTVATRRRRSATRPRSGRATRTPSARSTTSTGTRGTWRGSRCRSDLRATSDLEEAASEADVLVVGVPSTAFRGSWRRRRPTSARGSRWSSLTKGFECGTYMRMTEVIDDVLPGRPGRRARRGPTSPRRSWPGSPRPAWSPPRTCRSRAALQNVLAPGAVPDLHEPRRRRLRGRRRAEERRRHRRRHGAGPRRRRQHPVDGHHAGPVRADPPRRGHGRRAGDVRRAGRDGRPHGDLHQPASAGTATSASSSARASRSTTSWPG